MANFGVMLGSAAQGFERGVETWTRLGFAHDENERAKAQEGRAATNFANAQADRAAEQRSYAAESKTLRDPGGSMGLATGPTSDAPIAGAASTDRLEGGDTGQSAGGGSIAGQIAGLDFGASPISVDKARENYKNDPNKFTKARYDEAIAARDKAISRRLELLKAQSYELTAESNRATAASNRETAAQNRQINAWAFDRDKIEALRKDGGILLRSAIGYAVNLNDELPLADPQNKGRAMTVLGELGKAYETIVDGNDLQVTETQQGFRVRVVAPNGKVMQDEHVTTAADLKQMTTMLGGILADGETMSSYIHGSAFNREVDAQLVKARSMAQTDAEGAKKELEKVRVKAETQKMIFELDPILDQEEITKQIAKATSTVGDEAYETLTREVIDPDTKEKVKDTIRINKFQRMYEDKLGVTTVPAPSGKGNITTFQVAEGIVSNWKDIADRSNGDPRVEDQLVIREYIKAGFDPTTAQKYVPFIRKKLADRTVMRLGEQLGVKYKGSDFESSMNPPAPREETFGISP